MNFHCIDRINKAHLKFNNALTPAFPIDLDIVVLGMGCFWGAERKFWTLSGVYTTAVGYTGGTTVYPTYQQVCTGTSGHAEVVLVVFDNRKVALEKVLKTFWESHNPTQGMRQGNDSGEQYRSVILTTSQEQHEVTKTSLEKYQRLLCEEGINKPITTQVGTVTDFYYAEQYHQQYLIENPNGYCGLSGTGVGYDYCTSQ